MMKYIIPFLIFIWTSSCDLEKEVDINLPEYETQLVVECYVQPHQRYSLLLSRSSGYFDPFVTSSNQFLEDILEDSAYVVIRHNDEEIILRNRLGLAPDTRKVVNYFSTEMVPADYGSEFELEIITKDGEMINAKTTLLEPIPIDSVVVQFNETDSLARVLTYFTDIPGEKNYFRRQLHLSSLDSLPEQDFTTDDRVVEDVVVFGTGYEFSERDTVINTLYHIDEAYYNFLESVQLASSSNGNPFGQPSPIVSTFESEIDVIGIFAGISFDREFTIIKK